MTTLKLTRMLSFSSNKNHSISSHQNPHQLVQLLIFDPSKIYKHSKPLCYVCKEMYLSVVQCIVIIMRSILQRAVLSLRELHPLVVKSHTNQFALISPFFWYCIELMVKIIFSHLSREYTYPPQGLHRTIYGLVPKNLSLSLRA